MNYIEKEKLIKADIASIENRVRHAFNQGYDLGYKEAKANCSEIPTGSTTKNCRTCRNFGSHHGICEICKDNKCWTEKEPTTKNDSPKYCDRSICLKNGYNNVGCEDCEVTKSQESSGDNVVSRDVVKKQMIMYGFHAPDMTVTEFVEDLPSVTPQEPKIVSIAEIKYDKDKLKELVNKAVLTVTPQQPKTGHWNDIPKYTDIAWECSECGRFTTLKHNYCPMCGAKMVEPQESEDKE